MSDSDVIIGTKIDTSGIEEGIEKIKTMLKSIGSSLKDMFKTCFEAGLSLAKTIGVVLISIGKVLLTFLKLAPFLGAITLGGIILGKAFQKVVDENQELIANIKYIIFAIGKALEPAVNSVADVIAKIVNMLIKAFQVVALIIQMLTGKNIFAGATPDKFAESMKSAEKSTKGTAKNLKDMKKQLAGFDEMNVLQDTSSSGGGGAGDVGGGGITMPTIDLSDLSNVELPKWIQWLFDNGELLKNIIIGIGIALASLKIAEFLQTLGLFASLPLWQLVLGIGLILGGIVIAVQGILAFIKDPSWQNFLTILEGIALVVAGIAVLMGGWVVALVAVGVAIVAHIIKNWDKVCEVLGVVGEWIYSHVIEPVIKFFQFLWDSIKSIFKPFIDFFVSIFTTIWSNIQVHINNIIVIVKYLWNIITSSVKEWWNNVMTILSPIVNFVWNHILQPLITKVKGVIDIIWSLVKTIATTVGDVIGGVFKAVVNGIMSAIESTLNSPIKAINKLINKIKVVPGLEGLKTLNTFSLPRLAKGGIVSMPGRGVPIGGAIAGENKREAVLPLQDSQVLSEIGQAIGRYVTINATIENSMNGRIISRELKRVNAEDNFAYNG